ncbi:spherulin-2A-like [Achroia grisella]|uniref:spherulin-2A-like n=1 Tax=Achroia grisella TaxID=688607 RepID=UPI0027D1F49C|nr:spherulin-2A-like [Achroia grisella]
MAGYLLLLLPSLVLAKIDIELEGTFAEGDASQMKVYTSGRDIEIISDMERKTFDIEDNNLKNCVNTFFGARPNDAFVRSPTPWNDLYQTYSWNEVARTLVPRNGRVMSISSQPTIVVHQTFENNSTIPGTFNVGISQTVENTVASAWTTGGELSIGQEIRYGFKIGHKTTGGALSFTYTSSYGKSVEHSQSVLLGTSSGMNVLLEPGQSVVSQLHATRGSIKIEVEYAASLSGSTAVNYSKKYKGHHFWGLNIRNVMSSCRLSNSKVTTEVIEIGFYANSKIVVNDRRSGKKIVELDV